ncbi:MAG: symmetrical bis(5'-nucleosyl)-tetraphosphatase [Gammaproteobacteria bacterium]|nr:symmetrical bis(5'-nucleosyl)-tetraphosphatase [Gammaproteobacteria bacterium]
MATYAIGDLQGCLRELEDLLDLINYDGRNDRLWFTGDLVNRGPESLEVLRYVRAIGESTVIVLGNHDLHLIAVASGHASIKKSDTLDSILAARDRTDLLDWLRSRPLLHGDRALGFTLIHAGLPPQWDIGQATEHARELEHVLGGDTCDRFLARMYGDQPWVWRDDLAGWDRLRFITNCFTRLRFCDADGRLALGEKGPPGSQPPPFLPWYEVPGRGTRKERIIFGHWSTLWLTANPDFTPWNVYPLDRGCVWGGELVALRLEDVKLFIVPSRQPKRFED